MPISQEVRKSLSLSWKEGIPANIMIGIIDYFIVPYALFLGASTQGIGFLVAIPHLIGSITQLFAPRLIRKVGSRLKFVVIASTIQALVLVPIALLALTPFSHRTWLLIGWMMFFRVLANLNSTAWGSLISEYLPPEKRGHFLGWRSQVIGFAGLVGLAFAGLLLFFLKKESGSLAFFVLFSVASLCRLVSSALIAQMADVPLSHYQESDFTFYQFIRRFRESNFVKFIFFVSSVMFSAHLAAPFFSVYMLRDLHFSYLYYLSVNISGVIAGLIAVPLWGKHADMIGNAKILKAVGFIIPLVPLLWLFSENLFYLMCVEFVAGFTWAGFNLCAANFIYDAVVPQKRVRCIGYFSLFNGVAIFLGSSLGGFLADRLPRLWGPPLLTLFLISSFFRFASLFILSGKFKEVRATAHRVSGFKLFISIVGFQPLMGLTRGWSAFPSEHEK